MRFTTYVEIPITVFFSMQKYVPRSHHEEGQSGGPIIDDVWFNGVSAEFKDCDLPDEVKKYIFAIYKDNLTEQCWDNIE